MKVGASIMGMQWVGSVPLPSDLSGLAAWYDASDTSTITHSGGAVSQWNDKSGNARHATQATGALQPITGVRTINGLNVLNHIGQWMSLPSGLYNIAAGENTVFIVLAHNNPSWIGLGFIEGKVSTNRRYGVRYHPSNGLLGCASGIENSDNTVARNTDPHIFGFVASTVVSTFVDGVTLPNTSARNNVTLTELFTGGYNTTNHALAEIVIYTRALTTTEKNNIGRYLSKKWGTTWSIN